LPSKDSGEGLGEGEIAARLKARKERMQLKARSSFLVFAVCTFPELRFEMGTKLEQCVVEVEGTVYMMVGAELPMSEDTRDKGGCDSIL